MTEPTGIDWEALYRESQKRILALEAVLAEMAAEIDMMGSDSWRDG
jgi:hypothetical protein